MNAQPKLKVRYHNDIIKAMREDFGYKNVNEVPRIEKIVVNIGMGEALQNGRGRPGNDHWTETGDHQGPALDCDVQAA